MPKYFENDTDYNNEAQEIIDSHEAKVAKTEASKTENVMDFDKFIREQGIGHGVQSKNS